MVSGDRAEQHADSGVNQCREICTRASKEKDKLINQIQKLKDRKATKVAGKKVAGRKGSRLNEEARKKEKEDALKEIKMVKDKIASITVELENIGEKLLCDLVKVIGRKGNLNDTVKTMQNMEVGGPWGVGG